VKCEEVDVIYGIKYMEENQGLLTVFAGLWPSVYYLLHNFPCLRTGAVLISHGGICDREGFRN
jgi:hypothetical protein